MRTPKELYPVERMIYKPGITMCLHCGRPLALCNYLAWDKRVQTLAGVMSVASRPGHCVEQACPGYPMRVLSAEGQQVGLPNSTYGYDVLARIGWLRQEHRDTYAEIRSALMGRYRFQRHIYGIFINKSICR